MSTIVVSRDFSSAPGGRFRATGPDSGEEFRERLARELKKSTTEIIVVELDGTEGYGSSFLEEAFGGLFRHVNLDAETILRRVNVVARTSRYKTYEVEALDYMREAAKAKQR